MPVKKRPKATGRAKKVAGPAVVVDLLDSDDDATLAQALEASAKEAGIVTDMVAEEKALHAVKADLDQDEDWTSTPDPTANTASSTSPTTAPNMPIKRSATLPICQILSKSSTPLNSRNNSSVSNTQAEPQADSQSSDFNIPKAASNPNFSSLDGSDDEEAETMGFMRRPTIPLSSSTSSRNPTPPTISSRTVSNATSSLPSKLSQGSMSTPSLNHPPLKSSSSLFRARDSIDANFIKSSSVEQLEALEEEFGKGKKRSSGFLTVAENMFAENSEEDDEEARNLLNPPPSKKRGRPSLTPGTKAHKFIENSQPSKFASTLSKAAKSTSSALPSGKADSYGYAAEPVAATAPAAKKFAPAVQRTTSNPDLLLEEILGADAMRMVNPAHTVTNYRNQMAEASALQTITMARRLLDDASRYAAHTSIRTIAPLPTSQYGQRQVTITIKAGKREIALNVPLSQTLSTCLVGLTRPDDRKLPMLLPNEKYAFKFDGITLDMGTTFGENHIGSKDLIIVVVVKDGKEIPIVDEEDLGEGEDGGVVEEDLTGNKIVITVKFPDGKTQAKFRIARDKPLSVLAEKAAEKLKVNPALVSLKFDGDLLNLKRSSDELDEPLEDEDMVDLVIKK